MIITIFGKPRAGKTTLLASVARRNYIKREKYYKRVSKSKLYKRLMEDITISSKIRTSLINSLYPKNFYDIVYSTDHTIHHTIPITYEQLGTFRPTVNSLFLLEEAGIGLDSRNFKNLSKYSSRFPAIHGHLHVDIIIVSQSVDVDKKYRQRSELMYIARKLGPWTLLKKIKYEVGIDELTHNLVDAYWKQDVWRFLLDVFTNNKKNRWSKLPFEKSRLIWRRAWYPYFNSWEDSFEYPCEDPVKSYVIDYDGEDTYLNLLKEQALKELEERRKEEKENEEV